VVENLSDDVLDDTIRRLEREIKSVEERRIDAEMFLDSIRVTLDTLLLERSRRRIRHLYDG